MKYIKVQESKIPVLGYGTWKLKDKECEAGVASALEIGYRHIDTAQIYENETQVGTAISDSGIDRKDIFLTTKIWMSNVGEGNLPRSLDESLKKLKTDYVDLLLIHWPVAEVPFAEQMKALRAVQEEGLTKLIGVSNFTVEQLKQVREEIGAPVVNNQVEYHPFLSQQPVLDYLRSHDMFLTAYSPVARGKVMDNETVQKIGEKYGKNAAQIGLRWLIQQDCVAAIPKAAKAEHAKSNFEIFDFELTAEEMQQLHNLSSPQGRMVNPDWAPQWDQAA